MPSEETLPFLSSSHVMDQETQSPIKTCAPAPSTDKGSDSGLLVEQPGGDSIPSLDVESQKQVRITLSSNCVRVLYIGACGRNEGVHGCFLNENCAVPKWFPHSKWTANVLSKTFLGALCLTAFVYTRPEKCPTMHL